MPAHAACRTHLDLSYCGLNAAPTVISRLTALRSLRLARNPLTGGDLHPVCRLPALAVLDVCTCRISELPEAVTALSSTLTSLDLSGNRQLAPEPLRHQLVHLSRLQRFSASGCGVQLPAELADALATLPLRHLAISGNKLLEPPPGSGQPRWTPLLNAVMALRAAGPPPPALPITEQPPGLPALEARIAEEDWRLAADAYDY